MTRNSSGCVELLMEIDFDVSAYLDAIIRNLMNAFYEFYNSVCFRFVVRNKMNIRSI